MKKGVEQKNRYRSNGQVDVYALFAGDKKKLIALKFTESLARNPSGPYASYWGAIFTSPEAAFLREPRAELGNKSPLEALREKVRTGRPAQEI